MKLIKIAGY